jgi:hypothetical protein
MEIYHVALLRSCAQWNDKENEEGGGGGGEEEEEDE